MLGDLAAESRGLDGKVGKMKTTNESRIRTSIAGFPAIWISALKAAQTERDLAFVVKDYLATWSPLELSRLPESCRPGRINGADDIVEIAYKLSTARIQYAAGDLTDALLLDRMMTFFMHAATRVSQIDAIARRFIPESEQEQ